eukprot:746904-Hanusia_phi.AAC.3
MSSGYMRTRSSLSRTSTTEKVANFGAEDSCTTRGPKFQTKPGKDCLVSWKRGNKVERGEQGRGD